VKGRRAFLKKGAPKTFAPLEPGVCSASGGKQSKVFWFFFSKKNLLTESSYLYGEIEFRFSFGVVPAKVSAGWRSDVCSQPQC
jgi:hypothetical protein